ncbi:MAG: hypothetical protein ABIZ05_14115 [Pseudonocardiaceae bacterium]
MITVRRAGKTGVATCGQRLGGEVGAGVDLLHVLARDVADERHRSGLPPCPPGFFPLSRWGGGSTVDSGLVVSGVLVWVGGERGPAAFVGAGDRVRVGLGASELAEGPGARLVKVVDDRDREVERDIEHGVMFLGELGPRRGELGRGHDQDEGLLDRGPDRRGGVEGGAAGERQRRGGVEDPPADHAPSAGAGSPYARRTTARA